MYAARRIKGRYELLGLLGEGGMGVVYSANDLRMKRRVALKTIRTASDRTALELFERECEVLVQLSHPNIVEIFDVGEFEEDGIEKPYFVMPLLEGRTLDALMREGGLRLAIPRAAELIVQACRGLQAAHERGLIHRDLKPSNIFILQDDSVKVIDFGIAHMTSRVNTDGRKGTPFYMSPEQIESKTITPLSDQFALGVLCYEAMTGRRPFDGQSDRKLAHAILHDIPPPACDLNPSVNRATSQVIAKAMAKKPYHRFSSTKEFAVVLQKAVNGEAIVVFEPAVIAARLARAERAFQTGDTAFASELLDDLQSEGYSDEAVTSVRRQVEEAQLQATIRTLLVRAYSHLREDEHALALQKVQDILDLDPHHSEALTLKQEIEQKRTERRVDDWLRLAAQHVEARDFAHASEALNNVLELQPGELRARSMLADVERRQQEYLKIKQEKEALYQDALRAWHNHEITTALGKLERILHMEGAAPEDSLGEATYQELYNTVCSERDAMENAIADARRHLAEGNFSESLAVCDRFLEKHPRHTRIQALRIDIEDTRRQQISELIAETNSRLAAEPDLDRRAEYLQEALARHPGEPHFEQALKALQERRELVRSIVAKARMQEEREQFAEALDQWQIVRSVHPQHPGVDVEMDRVRRRREQQMRTQIKSQWVERVDREIERGDLEVA
ncbi:MAG TPA: protein kinase, partial [Bryobacteraceae bacterium]|nr:protein kinase [Bryobacteraceae bacterium]